jgi:hypothetical protein
MHATRKHIQTGENDDKVDCTHETYADVVQEPVQSAFKFHRDKPSCKSKYDKKVIFDQIPQEILCAILL